MARVQLSPEAIELALPRVAKGLEKYSWLQRELHGRNVTQDGEYQTTFNGFYRVRRHLSWRRAFFGMLEEVKGGPVAIGETLQRLHAATGRIEASFSSKLVATVDPSQPVIDSVVLKNLGLRLTPVGEAPRRSARIVDLHHQLAAEFGRYLDSEEGRQLVARFQHAYPSSGISEVKMLDLVLWQTRPMAE